MSAILPIGFLLALLLAAGAAKAKAPPRLPPGVPPGVPPIPDGKITSPFKGVSAAAWSRFVKAMARGAESVVTSTARYGVFLFGVRRLADLGLMTNVRRGTLDGKTIWRGQWVKPYSQAAFLSSARLQYQTFVKSMALYAAKYKAVLAQNPGLLQLPGPPGPPTPTTPPPVSRVKVLRRGSKGPEVQIVQTRLNTLGFNVGLVDGNFGRRTEAAVKAFQQSAGLRPDGIVGPSTLAALKATGPAAAPPPSEVVRITPAPTTLVFTRILRRGSKGRDVVRLQRALNAMAIDVGRADGNFGRKTEAGVKAFQRSKGLRPDGIVGPKTGRALEASAIVSGAGTRLTLSGFLALCHLAGFMGAIKFLKGEGARLPATLALVRKVNGLF